MKIDTKAKGLKERLKIVNGGMRGWSGITGMSQSAAKLSVSIPLELATAVRRRVGARGLSSFVARAMEHELEREQLGSYLAELDAEHGPISKSAIARARRAWPKR